MSTISVSELRRHFERICDKLAGGEALVVTRRGKAVASLVPIEPPACRRKRGAERSYRRAMGQGANSQGVLEYDFQRRVNEWKQATRNLSSITEICMHPAYQQIVGMGAPAVPLLLKELQRRPGQWFWALKAITSTDPVPESSRGDVAAMTKAWLDWGRRRGLVP